MPKYLLHQVHAKATERTSKFVWSYGVSLVLSLFWVIKGENRWYNDLEDFEAGEKSSLEMK